MGGLGGFADKIYALESALVLYIVFSIPTRSLDCDVLCIGA